MTPVQLAVSMGCGQKKSILWTPLFNETFDRFFINTPLRQAYFIAQTGHESCGLIYTKEIASGSAYEGRVDLGNTSSGDGVKYKGRGLIQITGKANYQEASDFFDVDFINHPELMEQPNYAVLVSGWFWQTHHLNKLADLDLLTQMTKAINGGLNGYQDRLRRLDIAKVALGIK